MYWQVVRIDLVQHSQLRVDSPTSASLEKKKRTRSRAEVK